MTVHKIGKRLWMSLAGKLSIVNLWQKRKLKRWTHAARYKV